MKPLDEDGIDLNALGAAPATPDAPLEKEITLEFRVGDKSWDLVVSAIDSKRRSAIQRKRVALAGNTPFAQLAEEDQLRANCLATISACIDNLPKDLQEYLLTWDIVYLRLWEEVTAHNDAYFLSIFGEGAYEARAAD